MACHFLEEFRLLSTPLLSALHCDGSAIVGAANRDGVALAVARRHKERTFPEWAAPWSRCRLLVMANAVGGRWSSEALAFLRQLAKAKGRSETPLIRRRVAQVWKLRRLVIMSCAAARAVASSLLELRNGGADGVVLFLMRLRLSPDTRISSRFARFARGVR